MKRYVHFALTEDAFRNDEALQQALASIRDAGHFESLDERYAAAIGTLQGELPEEYVAAVRALPVVQALSEEQVWRALEGDGSDGR